MAKMKMRTPNISPPAPSPPKKRPMKFLYTVGGNVKLYKHFGKQCGGKATHMHSLVFRTALFLIAEN